jgi:membrane-bound lytic murein transglycosylase D
MKKYLAQIVSFGLVGLYNSAHGQADLMFDFEVQFPPKIELRTEDEETKVPDSPVMEEISSDPVSLMDKRPWRPPDYRDQTKALGWSPEAFDIPRGLEAQVQFWRQIYSRYSTDQGVLHDPEDITCIYQEIDFTDIMRQTGISLVKKQSLRERRVIQEKKRIEVQFKELRRIKDPADLPSGVSQKIWECAQKSDASVRFQLGQRDKVIRGIFVSGRYLEEFEQIFRDQGIPIELSRLAFVESSFNVMARSKVGASGLWQIMPATGRPFLMMNPAVDKRNHPRESTIMAARFLRESYFLLKSWPLAVTGYNHGPNGVLRLTQIHQSRELADLARKLPRKPRLGFASRNFYPSFLAIKMIEQEAPSYLGPVHWAHPLRKADFTIPTSLSYRQLLRWFDGQEDVAQIFNPHINPDARRGRVDIPPRAQISVPLTKESEMKQWFEDRLAEQKKRPALRTQRRAQGN